ncbi:Flowering time control protein FPA [Bienertia sinuspersici]
MPMKPRKQTYGSEIEAPPSHLWVGNLTPDVTESDLAELFDKHGVLDGITCYASRSYAFVYFKRVDDAVAAKDALQGFLINGNPIKIEFAKPAKPSKHVWVGGFGSSMTKEKLEEELSKFGKIEDLKFIRDRNTALVEFARLEDASAAVKNMNRLQIGDDRVRVDFLRSHPAKREQSDFHDMGNAQFKGVGGPDPSWINHDTMRNYPEPTYSGHKRMQPSQPFGGRKGQPSKVLWVGYPPSVVIDEEMLNNAMILYGEIERIKCFPSRHYSFVEFRSVEEARRAKEALQGRLFNDPRISIMFSNSDLAPGKEFGPPYPGFRGQRPDMFGNEHPFGPPLMDGYPSNRPMMPNNFHGPPGPNGLGPGVPRPFGPRGGMDPLLPTPDFHDPNMHFTMSELTANAPVNQRKLSPSAGGLLPSPAPGRGSYKISGWDVLDPNQIPRESKRSRISGPTSFHDPHTAGKGDEYIASAGPQLIGGPLGRAPVDNGLNHPELGKGNVMGQGSEDFFWRGVIAKGGNAVCHARCVPMGKGLECELPEVVNCSARTGLDMLAKHYAGAIGFDIVFFLPDSEDDFANYTEFLRYLGSKNRAGVAKLDDGTTLFLVPPSDFLTDVLKVTGLERLYGVVLKMPQQLPGGPSLHQPAHQSLPPLQQTESQLGPSHEYIAPEPAYMDYGRAVPDDTAIHSKASYPDASVPQEQPNEGVPSTSRPAVTLTPELIATLHAFMPANSPSSVTQSAQPQSSSSTAGRSLPVSTSDQVAFSQGWNQQPQVNEPTGQSQQFGVQAYPNAPLSNYNPYASNLNVASQPYQVPPANMQVQNPVYNFQDQGSVSSRHPNVHPVTAQSQQFVSPMQNMQPYPSEVPHDIQKGHGMVHGTPVGSYGLGDSQQQNNSGSYSSQVTGGNLSRPETMLPTAGNMNLELLNQPERSQTLPSGADQGSSEVEVDKNQRYQSTLQFAANLLLQIQQQQQQQQANSHMGNQQ